MKTNFYRAFEDVHRGSRDLIKNRLKVYLPFIKPLKMLAEEVSILDLGCGRGEWLELVKREGFLETGVDLDAGMLKACSELGLNAIKKNAITYLKEQPDSSFYVISAFHIVEHISFKDLQTIVAEALRVLKPGGLLIMETPNPENIVVGSCNFYLDPTHQRPIPPQLLSFLPEFFGFYRTKILRLQEPIDLTAEAKLGVSDVLGAVSPDYCVLAQKKANTKIISMFDEVFAKEYGISLAAILNKYQGQQNNIEDFYTTNIQYLKDQIQSFNDTCLRLDADKKNVLDVLKAEHELALANQKIEFADLKCQTKEFEMRATLAEQNAHDANERAMLAEQNAYDANERAMLAEQNAHEANERAIQAEQNGYEANERVNQAEQNAHEANERANLAEQNAHETNERANLAEQNTHEANERAILAEQKAHTINEAYHTIATSTCWKLTKPIRFIADILKWFFSRVFAWITFAPQSRPRRILKQSLINTKEYINKRPKLKNKIMWVLDFCPSLKNRLKKVGKINVQEIVNKPISTDIVKLGNNSVVGEDSIHNLQTTYRSQIGYKKINEKQKTPLEKWFNTPKGI